MENIREDPYESDENSIEILIPYNVVVVRLVYDVPCMSTKLPEALVF